MRLLARPRCEWIGDGNLEHPSDRERIRVEAFVVPSGAGTLTFVATGAVVALAPGVLVRVTPDTDTEWEITSPIRKLYIE